jgi:hypothetical protein
LGFAVAALCVAIATWLLLARSPTRQAAVSTRERVVTRHNQNWANKVNVVCKVGHELYPSIAAGANATVDDMSYAVNRLVDEVSAVTRVPADGTARLSRLELRGQEAASEWVALATRREELVTLAERRQAVRLTGQYVDQLVALGATACAALRPHDA